MSLESGVCVSVCDVASLQPVSDADDGLEEFILTLFSLQSAIKRRRIQLFFFLVPALRRIGPYFTDPVGLSLFYCILVWQFHCSTSRHFICPLADRQRCLLYVRPRDSNQTHGPLLAVTGAAATVKHTCSLSKTARSARLSSRKGVHE